MAQHSFGSDSIVLFLVILARYSLAAAAVLWLQDHGLTRLYVSLETRGWWYLGVSYLTVLILQAGEFYATHRLFHHPAPYAWFHQGHHRSPQPTPWTSYAFDLPEVVVHAELLVALAIVNHLNLHCLPLRFTHHLQDRWVIGPTRHRLYHGRSARDFGLTFSFQDLVCGKEDRCYATGLNSPIATS